MPALAAFQSAFLDAIARDPVAEDPPGLAVYRNTVWRSLNEALAAAYPGTARIVGMDWFRACAGVFVRAHPPRSPILADYGDAFPEFLAQFPPAEDLPFLSEVAAGERLWTESHLAEDAPPLDAATIGRFAHCESLDLPLNLHPATRFRAFQFPVATLMRLNRAADTPDDAFAHIAWEPEILGIFRPEAEVRLRELNPVQLALLEACRQGGSLADALSAAAPFGAEAMLFKGLADLCAAGAFTTGPAPDKPPP